jgi:hypothetical protein
MSEPKGCGRCEHYEPLDKLNGVCHRYPPGFGMVESDLRLPEVSSWGEWCGEFEPEDTDGGDRVFPGYKLVDVQEGDHGNDIE